MKIEYLKKFLEGINGSSIQFHFEDGNTARGVIRQIGRGDGFVLLTIIFSKDPEERSYLFTTESGRLERLSGDHVDPTCTPIVEICQC